MLKTDKVLVMPTVDSPGGERSFISKSLSDSKYDVNFLLADDTTLQH